MVCFIKTSIQCLLSEFSQQGEHTAVHLRSLSWAIAVEKRHLRGLDIPKSGHKTRNAWHAKITMDTKVVQQILKHEAIFGK